MSPANNPSLRSWISVEENSDFPIQNLPFGTFQKPGLSARVGVALGKYIIDVHALNEQGWLKDLDIKLSVTENKYLNELIGLGKEKTSALRERISVLFRHDNTELQNDSEAYRKYLHGQDEVEMLLPVLPGDYTDFYSSEVHATNVGKMFRPDNPLLPNWKHMPIGYHGRSSSIVVSGTSFHRPYGQVVGAEGTLPQLQPSAQLDFELEMAFITHQGPPMGERISTTQAQHYIFGMVLFNDWSARDIQKWEYVPLGPFLAKNFASSISPWVVTLDALEPFFCDGPMQEPEVLSYLKDNRKQHIDIQLGVAIQPLQQEPTWICKSNFKHLYWSIHQQLAHQTINGCPVNAGDLYGSGTISAPEETGYGSMLELSWRGTKPIVLKDGSTRTFLQDHDTVILKGWCENNQVRIGFGEVRNKILPAKNV